MKRTTTKIPAMIAMIISLLSFGFMIASLMAEYTVSPAEEGVGASFALWIYGTLLALISVALYTVDAVLSVRKVFNKVHPVFNFLLSALLFLAIPTVLFLGCSPGFGTYVWNVYHLLIFTLEIISIAKHRALNSKEAKHKACLPPDPKINIG